MRNWLDSEVPIPARPLVYIEDASSDVVKFCEELAKKEKDYEEKILEAFTVMLLDRPGPDTQKLVCELLAKYPSLQTVAGPFTVPLRHKLVSGIPNEDARSGITARDMRRRYADIPEDALGHEAGFVDFLDGLIRPGALVFCDINLRPLTFPAPPVVNKHAETLKGVVSAYKACLRQGEPLEAVTQDKAAISIISGIEKFLMVSRALKGLSVEIDHNLVFEKMAADDGNELASAAGAARQRLRERFPWKMKVRSDKSGCALLHRVGDLDAKFLNERLHLVVWPECDGRYRISGKAVVGPRLIVKQRPLTQTLIRMIERHLERDTSRDAEVSDSEIQDIIERARRKSTEGESGSKPAHLISSLREMLSESGQEGIVIRGHQGYFLSEKAAVALIVE